MCSCTRAFACEPSLATRACCSLRLSCFKGLFALMRALWPRLFKTNAPAPRSAHAAITIPAMAPPPSLLSLVFGAAVGGSVPPRRSGVGACVGDGVGNGVGDGVGNGVGDGVGA